MSSLAKKERTAAKHKGLATYHRRSQGCSGCRCTPGREKKFGAEFMGL